jgi:hypothetical protein
MSQPRDLVEMLSVFADSGHRRGGNVEGEEGRADHGEGTDGPEAIVVDQLAGHGLAILGPDVGILLS